MAMTPYEQRVFDELEHDLQAEFGRRFRNVRTREWRLATALIGCGVGAGLLALGIMTSSVFTVVCGVALAAIVVAAVVLATRRPYRRRPARLRLEHVSWFADPRHRR